MLRLYSYWRSSAAYRVRIALGLKDLDYELLPVHLVRAGGEHLQPGFRALNPQGLVPVLEHDGVSITQSLAVIEYLEEVFPQKPLLPLEPAGRARVRSLAQIVACDIHPLDNLRVLKYLKGPLGVSEAQSRDWYQHWIVEGFDALERRLQTEGASGRFCHGDTPGLADACLVPQVYNARRFNIALNDYPRIAAIEADCSSLKAFHDAAPEQQPDAE